MKGFTPLPNGYFTKYATTPVSILPFNPKSRITAERYIEKLAFLLTKFSADISLRGSTLYGIAGKGEIEIGIYPPEKKWKEIIDMLKIHFGKIGTLEKNYARFNDVFDGFEIEVILLRGHDAFVDKKLTEYILHSPKILREYEKLKRKFSYSKREYMIRKNSFFEKIISTLPGV